MGEIPNEGQVTITHMTESGVEVPFTFQNIKVAMPILSIRRVAARGSVCSFWKGGGEIRFPSGTIIPIVERLGVYFVRLNANGRAAGNNQGYHRPAP